MIIGIPKEIKTMENRVAITPEGVFALVQDNNIVLVEKNAGEGSGYSDKEYKDAGAVIVDTPQEIYEKSDMIVKIKAPQPSEYSLLRKGQILFTFLHLAVEKSLAKELISRKVTAIGYETIQREDASLPLLIPVSEIAGKMSVHVAANFLEKRNNGRGILLSGVAGVPAANILIIGAGHVGINAAKIASKFGCDICVADINTDKLRYIENLLGGRIKTCVPSERTLKELVKNADVIIGAVLVPGHKAPKLITEEMVMSMKKGSVIVDISIDQGGIAETEDRITTLDSPVYERYGVIHYCVENMPGSVPRTSTIALTNETIKYITKITQKGIIEAVKTDKTLAAGVNTFNGTLTNRGVAEALEMEYTELPSLIGF